MAFLKYVSNLKYGFKHIFDSRVLLLESFSPLVPRIRGKAYIKTLMNSEVPIFVANRSCRNGRDVRKAHEIIIESISFCLFRNKYLSYTKLKINNITNVSENLQIRSKYLKVINN